MKRNSIFLIIILLTTLFSCDLDEKVNSNGFIRIGVVTNTSVITKAEDDVEIKNIRLIISNITENSSDKDWSKEYNFAPDESIEDIELAPGKYKLVAIASNGSETSNGFNPVYRGETTEEVIAGETKSAQIECKLTTVKVLVEYDQNLKDTYQTEYKTVVGGVTFSSDEEGCAGYITPGDLSVDFMFKNNAGSWQTISLKKIAEAKACEYYKIKISMKSTEGGEGESSEGAANVTIQVGEENPQNIEIGIVLPKVTITTVKIDNDDVKCETAILKGNYTSPSATAPSLEKLKFFYKKKSESSWTTAQAQTLKNTSLEYQASLVGLTPSTVYEYKFTEKGNVEEFTTKTPDITLDKNYRGVTTAVVYGELAEANRNSISTPFFKYRKGSSEDWSQPVNATPVAEGTYQYKALLEGLDANVTYEYKFMEITEDSKSFTTLQSIQVLKAVTGADYAAITCDIPGIKEGDAILLDLKEYSGSSWSYIGKECDVVSGDITNGQFVNKLTGLEQNGTYCVDDETKSFTTLKNASFDTWLQDNKAWYANSIATYDFWATGNEGVIKANKPSNAEPVVGRDNVSQHAAKLKSISAKILFFGFFAAGNLYTGSFNFTSITDAMDANKAKKFPKFGQGFTSRPTGLKGWYKYTSQTINQGLDKSDSRYGTRDKCQIYVKLFTGDQYDASTITSTSYIAEGEFSSDKDVTEWTSFTFNIAYNDLVKEPTKIAIVATSSIYGGDFIGALDSELCVDDFELIYDYTKPPYTN